MHDYAVTIGHGKTDEERGPLAVFDQRLEFLYIYAYMYLDTDPYTNAYAVCMQTLGIVYRFLGNFAHAHFCKEDPLARAKYTYA